VPINIAIQGVEATLRQLRAIGQAVPEAAEEGCLKVAQGIAARAADLTRVDTGTLKRAWGAWRIKGGAVVGIKPDSERAALDKRGRLVARNPEDYAWWQEIGTAKMEANPMLRPAVDEVTQSAPGVIGEVVERRIEQVLGK
jgi:HK97 gp10 family phage protein